jgi:Uma2 family endonuclease
MVDQGLLTERYELIEGEIISKMGQKRAHAIVIIRLTAWLIALFGPEFVQFQLPILVPGKDAEASEPEPDAAVLCRPATDFLEETPDAASVLLIIEVADSTLKFDRSTKAGLYARAEIPEYWVVDIEGRQLFAHREPTNGSYANAVVYAEGDEIACIARPAAPMRVSELLPPAK